MLKNNVFLRVRMTDCDADALCNPHNVGVHGWELPDAKNVVFTVLCCTFDKKSFKTIVFLRVRMRICDAGALRNPRNVGADRAPHFARLLP